MTGPDSTVLAGIGMIFFERARQVFTSPMELVKTWRARSKKIMPIPAKTVESGPVMEHVDAGAAVNVLKFPTPKWHEHDGGRYIGTGSVDITRDPEEGWVNLGCYRVMI